MTVLLFAGVREAVGASTCEFTVVPGTTVGTLRRHFVANYPEMASLLAVSRIAVNHAFATDDLVLAATDEVAIIPPVSGG